MHDLKQLVGKVTEEMALDVLQSSLSYPRTASIQYDKPHVVWVMKLPSDNIIGPDDVKSFEDAVDKAKVNPELHAINAVADVQQALKMLGKLDSATTIRMFDCVQLYRGGVELLRMEFAPSTHPEVGRTVFMEINDYRRRLLTLAMDPSRPTYIQGAAPSTAFILTSLSVMTAALTLLLVKGFF